MTADFMHNSDHASVDSQPSLDPVAASDGPDSQIEACWGRVNQRMRKDIGDAAWRNWIKPLRVSRLEDGTLTLEADSTLARERVSSQYADRLRVISAAEFGDVVSTIRHIEVRLASVVGRPTQGSASFKWSGSYQPIICRSFDGDTA